MTEPVNRAKLSSAERNFRSRIAQLASGQRLLRGTLSERSSKCGKPNCHCAQKDSPGHGPSYSLTHASAGKTITQVIPQGPAIDRTRAQISEYRRFRKLVQELIAVSEQLCNAQLQQPEALVAEESKKKPLRRSPGQRRRAGD